MIKLEHVNKYYNKNKTNEIHVINDINLTLPSAGMIAIFGRSGCGKTTLLNAIGGLDEINDGKIIIDEDLINSHQDELRNKKIGYIFQNYLLNENLTCFENIANALYLCGMQDEELIKQMVNIALENVGMAKYQNRYPNTLSGGQMQRIAIARAIVKNPPVILADEPTGNLDEANTIMIMDLLKALSKDHLVLLVTHEADLVDYYCEQVIELNDGKIINIRKNDHTNGYENRKKTDIYLDELPNQKMHLNNLNIDYYGEPLTDVNINIQLVNYNGHYYLQVLNNNVKIIDETSEIKLKKGTFIKKEQEAPKELTMQNFKELNLPNLERKNYGKLFTLKKALQSGYLENIKQNKKSQKILIVFFMLFAVIFCFVSAQFASTLNKITKIEDGYNHHVFYVYTKNNQVLEELEALKKTDSGIDDYNLAEFYPLGDRYLYFNINVFETFIGGNDQLTTNAAMLSLDLINNKEVLAGKTTNLSTNEIVISKQVADQLLSLSTYGYLKNYDDLLGITCSTYDVEGKYLKIAGIVNTSESAVYLNNHTLGLMEIMRYSYMAEYFCASDYNIELEKGEVLLVTNNEQDYQAFNQNETFLLAGKQLIIKNKEIVDFEEENILSFYNTCLFLNQEDLADLARITGETDERLIGRSNSPTYTAVHSNNPKLTEKIIQEHFGSLEAPTFYDDTAILTPKMIKKELLSNEIDNIIVNVIIFAILLTLISLCMYFIMRSSLISQVKEIGIYRAIGVSKTNMLFKFMIETLVLIAFSIFIGWLIISILLLSWLNNVQFTNAFLYYSPLIALVVLVIMIAVCLICGMLPVMKLLKKTPSAILTKYDI